MKNNKKEAKAKNKNGFFVKLMAWILCILMVVSMAYLTVVLVVDQIKTRNEEEHQHTALLEYKESV